MITRHKTLLVTGSTGNIGSEICLKAAKEGFSIALHYNKNYKKVNFLAQSIKKIGVDAFPIKADLRNQSEIKTMFLEIDKRWNNLTSVVNNAAISGDRVSLINIKGSKVEEIFKINFYACFEIMKESIKRMKISDGGSIVNISSNAIKTGGYNIAAYLASKQALESLSKSSAKEFSKNNIRINIVRPGIIGFDDSVLNEPLNKKKKVIPMNRLGKPIEVANSVVWLLSEKASYLCGATISVTGGY